MGMGCGWGGKFVGWRDFKWLITKTMCFTRADAVVTKVGVSHHGRPRVGGSHLVKKKLPFTKAHPGVTKDFAPRQTSRGGGPFGN